MNEPRTTNITYLGLAPAYAEAIERLREECRELRSDFKDGYTTGHAWALTYADYPTLREFADQRKDTPTNMWCNVSTALRNDLNKRLSKQGHYSEAQWQYGFCQAVLDVWDKIHKYVEEGDPLHHPRFNKR